MLTFCLHGKQTLGVNLVSGKPSLLGLFCYLYLTPGFSIHKITPQCIKLGR